jgi:uncharacterized protein (TIGR02453 family)
LSVKILTMEYFSTDFNQFFIELAGNNHKDWFDTNRKRYEKNIKEPFKQFTSALIEEVRKHEPSISLEPKNAIFRINRDIRFSKEKIPYKLFMSAVVSPLGKKDKTNPGIYVQLGPEDVRIYGGVYVTDKDQLLKMRQHIADNLKGFDKAIQSDGFQKYYSGAIHGDKHKRLPKEMQAAAEKQPLLYNKSFYYFNKLDADLVHSPKLMETIMEHYHAAKPVREFLANALK